MGLSVKIDGRERGRVFALEYRIGVVVVGRGRWSWSLVVVVFFYNFLELILLILNVYIRRKSTDVVSFK